MNPPFKSWQSMDSHEQDAVSHAIGASSSKPNLAMAFASLALRVLNQDGVLAMIAPNSLLEGDSGRETREAIADSLSPRLVARLGNQSIFARALVDAGLYVGKRKSAAPTEPAAILWADSRQNSLNYALRGLRRWRGAEIEPIKGEGFSVYLRKDIATSGDAWVARSYDSWSRYRRFQHSDKMQLASRVFDIRQGVRLGNDVFIVSKEYVHGLRRDERRFFRPAVMNPSIVDGKLGDTLFVWYPYTIGLPPITTEKQLKEHVPQYYKDHLDPAKQALKARKTLVRQTELNWWDLLWPRSWQKAREPKIVSKYFGGSRAFAFDRSGDSVVVVGHAWLLKKGRVLQEVTDDDKTVQEVIDTFDGNLEPTDDEAYLATLAYLNSSVAYDLIEYLSPQVAGGQLDLSNRFVSNLPVPNLAKLKDESLSELIQAGTEIAGDKTFDRWSEVDEIVLSALSE
jgi:adenine-specific DNA-methyltransferase